MTGIRTYTLMTQPLEPEFDALNPSAKTHHNTSYLQPTWGKP